MFGKHNKKSCFKVSFSMKYEENKEQMPELNIHCKIMLLLYMIIIAFMKYCGIKNGIVNDKLLNIIS